VGKRSHEVSWLVLLLYMGAITLATAALLVYLTITDR
jgi:hypothetical protein